MTKREWEPDRKLTPMEALSELNEARAAALKEIGGSNG